MDDIEIPEGHSVMYRSADHIFVLVRDSDGEVIRTVRSERSERQVR